MKKQFFGTDGIRGRVGDALINPEFMLKLGWAVGSVLRHDENPRVVIGKDTRISGYMLESALEAGLAAAGVDVLLLGPMPTPAIAYLTRTFRAAAGVVISASHNPFYDNGVKFFYANGMKLSDELELAIEAQMSQSMEVVASADLGKASRVKDAAGRYIEFCKSTFPNQLTLNGLKIVVDCAHGASYHVASHVFHELGAEVDVIGAEPDGLNINLERGATDIAALREAVKINQADVGIAFDGDADRCIMVDEKGEVVDGDEILAILTKAEIDETGKVPEGVVGTIMSNAGLEAALTAMGVKLHRAKVGDRHVMEALTAKDWTLGGESSGHIVNLALTTTGDGIISALGVLRAMQFSEKSLHVLKKVMCKFPQTMINVPTSSRVQLQDYPEIAKAIEAAEVELGKRGRVLVRPSGTEPVVRVMVEANDEALANKMANRLANFINQQLV